ncbi:sulfite reductase flavoprotein subunit alpha [Solimonas sp. K1W22B-7]|nr:sulfite reductase flavoprotein subunit alpha [Solimonas sp. K1W22B-7]
MLRAGTVVLAWLLLCVFIAWARRRQQRRLLLPITAGSSPILVAYASQTGFAQRIAMQTAQSLQASGAAVRLQSLGEVTTATLQAAGRVLFVTSTTGEGDPPDTSIPFVRKVMRGSADMQGLHYGLLALGDREYRHYCGFGHELDRWLRKQGAQPLFDAVEVDNADEGALRHWQHHLELLGGGAPLPDWSAPEYQRWRLVGRRLLNPGSLGGPAFHLALEPLQGIPQWRAGDIAEIGPRNATQRVADALREIGLPSATPMPEGEALSSWLARSLLPRDLAELRGVTPEQLAQRLHSLPHREYSIASIPADGRLELLLRQMRQSDGSLGLGSGWLTEYAAVGDEVALRIRENPGFQPPPDARPLILVGNGTGLAGLRAQLKARVAAGHKRNWLLFGERSRAHDYFHRDELEAWQKAGYLERLDVVFSRDQEQRVYVQDRLYAAADALQAWVKDGAAVYVCGSLEGMAPAVGRALTDVLGAETVERMLEEGRYRRDVY